MSILQTANVGGFVPVGLMRVSVRSPADSRMPKTGNATGFYAEKSLNPLFYINHPKAKTGNVTGFPIYAAA